MIVALLVVSVACVAVAAADVVIRLARWRDDRRAVDPRNEDSGEICHHPDCLRELTWAELWESRVVLPEEPEAQVFGGGTFMRAHWCSEHRPPDAVRSHP